MINLQNTISKIGRWLKSLRRRSPKATARQHSPLQVHRSKTIPVDPDMLALVEFGSAPRTVLPMTSVVNPQVIPACRQLTANAGGTALDKGLETAMQLLTTVDRKIIRRVVLISDGEPTCPAASLMSIAQRMAQQQIRLDCISVGPQAGSQLLHSLAKATYRGHFFAAGNFKALAGAVLKHVESGRRHRFRGATVLLIDASGSMNGPMPMEPRRSRIQACQEVAEAFVKAQRRLYGHKVC